LRRVVLNVGQQRGGASSRPPRTGSIAACFAGGTLSGSTGVVPSAKDGLHCGRIDAAHLAETVPVVPSAKDGLHCGIFW